MGFELVPIDDDCKDDCLSNNPDVWAYRMQVYSGDKVVMRRSCHGMTKPELDVYLKHLDGAPNKDDDESDVVYLFYTEKKTPVIQRAVNIHTMHHLTMVLGAFLIVTDAEGNTPDKAMICYNGEWHIAMAGDE